MTHTAESNFLNFVIEYLSEIETEFENTLACLSGAQMGFNHDKNWRSKISWHTPLKGTVSLVRARLIGSTYCCRWWSWAGCPRGWTGSSRSPNTSRSDYNVHCFMFLTAERWTIQENFAICHGLLRKNVQRLSWAAQKRHLWQQVGILSAFCPNSTQNDSIKNHQFVKSNGLCILKAN